MCFANPSGKYLKKCALITPTALIIGLQYKLNNVVTLAELN